MCETEAEFFAGVSLEYEDLAKLRLGIVSRCILHSTSLDANSLSVLVEYCKELKSTNLKSTNLKRKRDTFLYKEVELFLEDVHRSGLIRPFVLDYTNRWGDCDVEYGEYWIHYPLAEHYPLAAQPGNVQEGEEDEKGDLLPISYDWHQFRNSTSAPLHDFLGALQTFPFGELKDLCRLSGIDTQIQLHVTVDHV